MKKIFLPALFIFLTIISNRGYAQLTAASYGFTAFTSPYTSISTTGTSTTAISVDDAGLCSVPIGFSFVYCGTTYTMLAANSNGYLSLANNCGSGAPSFTNASTSLSSISGGVGMLMPFWDDLDGTGDIAYYSTTGPVGSRIFTFEWNNFSLFVNNTVHSNIQVKLHEGTNYIDFCYGPSSYSSGSGTSGTIGIANSPTDWQTLPNSGTTPVPSSTTFTVDLTTTGANGQVYRWEGCNTGTITGTKQVCAGSTTTLTDITTTGTWSSSTTTIATVGSSTGVVTGVAGGTSTISYTASAGCYTVCVVTVNPTPVAITGTTHVCQGATTTLTDATAGGTWSSGTTSVATITTGGVVTGVAAGTSTITYSLGSCYVTTVVTVNTQPAEISGATNVCQGTTTTLTDATASGTWSSTTTTVATINTGGIVTGVATGTTTISYTLGNCVASEVISVNSVPVAITGNAPICQTLTKTLSDVTTGGTWSSGTTSVATITAGGVVTGVGVGTSTITYAVGSCFVTTIVTVTAQPAAISGTAYACQGGTTTLSDATSGGTWSSTTTTIATITTGGIVTGVATGTTTISYTIGACAATQVVMVNAQPLAISGNAPICQTFTKTLSDATAGGAWSSSTTSVATVTAGGVVTGGGVGTSTITYAIGSCYVTTVVTVNTQPVAITGTASVCQGATTALTDATGSGAWTSTNTTVATITTGGIVTGANAGTTTISYTIGSCAATEVVTVNTQPAAIAGNAPICQTFTKTLSDATAGGTWSSSTTTVATITGGGVVTGVGVGTSTITYAVGSCYVTAIVTVNEQPAVITGAVSVCQGSTTALTDATTGGVWSSVTPTIATITGTGILTGVALGTTVISYTLGSCAATQVVTVNTQPLVITGNTPVCQTFTITLSDATAGGTWGSSTTTVATITSGGVVTGVGVGTSTITYTVGGCYVTTIVTVNTQPAAITGTASVCQGSATTLTDATSGGVWSSVTTGIATITGSGVVTGVAVGTSIVSYTIGSCAATQIVTVNTQPVAITGSVPVCQTFTIALTDATIGGTWSSSTTSVATVTAGGVVTGVGVGTSTITYTVGSCYVTTIVTVNTQPAAITGTPSVCVGFTTTLTDATGGGAWSSVTTAVATITGGGVITGNAVGTSVISYTIGSCVATQTVTVNTQPVPITGNVPLCETSSITLSDATGGGTWSSITTTIATITGGGVVTGAGVGTSTISYTIGGCAVTTVVTVNTQPAVISGNLSACLGFTITLSDATGGGVWSSVTTTVATITGGGVVTGAATGTSTISYTIGSCAATAIVTVNALPANITGTKTVCSGSTTALFDGTGGGTWSSSNTAVATIGLISGVVTGGVVVVATTATITYTAGTGCVITTVVTVNPLPTVISGASAVCFGSAISLSDAGGGIWSSANTGIASVSAGGIVTGVSVGVTTITYTIPTGCYVTIPMTVDALPGAISGPTQVCPLASITLSDGTAGGTWSSSNTGIATVGLTTGIVTGVASGTVNVIYTTGAAGCTTAYTITVNPAPAPVVTPVGDTTFCPGGFVALTANTGTGFTYQWYINTGAIPGAVLSSYIANAAGSYQVLETNSIGCSIFSTPMLVTIDTAVAVITAGSSTNICSGSSVTLNANTGIGFSYQWMMGGVAISGAIGSSYTASAAGDYYVIVTNATGCSATSNVIAVSINPSPTANIVLSGPLTFCQGDSVVMTTGFATGNTYQWYNAAGAIPGANGLSYTATTAAAYYVIVTNSYGCTATSIVMTTVVNPLPDVTITASGPTLFCIGSSVTLSATAVAGYTYQWYVGGAPIAGATNSSYLVTTGGGYQVQITNPVTGCTGKTLADTTVTVVNNPVVVPLTPASFCWGGSALLTTSLSGVAGAVTYQWYFNGAIIPGATGATYNATIAGIYSCQITIPGSCTVSTVSVPVIEYPLPNPLVTFDGTYLRTGSFYVSYQWYLNLGAIPGAIDSFTTASGPGNYKVAVTDTNGCQSYSDVYVYTGGATTAIQNINQNDIKIYPNPTQAMVHIESAATVRAIISGIDGRSILNIPAAKDIDISRLADGIYMISLYDDKGVIMKTEKLVKAAN